MFNFDVSSKLGECVTPSFKGDNFCDDENNNAGCEYDGGDCCGPNVRISTMFPCKKCQCLDPSYGG